MILSLQGCMAVGKTTAVRYLQEHAPDIHISYEDNSDVIAQIKGRDLDKNKYEDYLEIQRLWLRKEVVRWEKAQQYPCTVMDFGAEEIEFYTLNYPKTIGMDWKVASALKPELDAVRKCMPDRILFLNASEETLRRNKQNDTSRSRNFFDHYLRHFLPLKKAWFLGRRNVDVLDVDGLTPEELGQKVHAWVDHWAKMNVFYENAKLLNEKWGITPLLYGSLGLEHLTGERMNADDVDVLIPTVFLTTKWVDFCSLLQENGHRLVDEHEHTFEKDGIHISYARSEELGSFAGIAAEDIPIVDEQGVRFLRLTLEQYLRVYTASSKDGYRRDVKEKKDQEKIDFIYSRLNTEERKKNA